MACQKNHANIQEIMAALPYDQGGRGRHKCAACAYVKGYEFGQRMDEDFRISEILDQLDESQAQQQRHKSPHAAFAKGYLDGVCAAYGVTIP